MKKVPAVFHPGGLPLRYAPGLHSEIAPQLFQFPAQRPAGNWYMANQYTGTAPKTALTKTYPPRDKNLLRSHPVTPPIPNHLRKISCILISLFQPFQFGSLTSLYLLTLVNFIARACLVNHHWSHSSCSNSLYFCKSSNLSRLVNNSSFVGQPNLSIHICTPPPKTLYNLL